MADPSRLFAAPVHSYYKVENFSSHTMVALSELLGSLTDWVSESNLDILISVIIFLQQIWDYDASEVLSLHLNKHCLWGNYKGSNLVCDVLCLHQYVWRRVNSKKGLCVFVFDYFCSLDVNSFPYYMHTKDSRWKSSLDRDKSKCHNTQILIMPTEFTFTGWMTLLVQKVIIANQYTYSNYFHFLL